ncbi:MAG TPA: GMC oxidoreductase [Methylibium sp.]|uniref:GMC oxidoreductase n=1 Tax=Methylibium sp. TaxID=2067992 RepID=UPI002DBDD026|nr:GMC oxidoreductase [Methylibium sp.]HEU4460333.1 GMC oxidoreductase [Methylibium sp.]
MSVLDFREAATPADLEADLCIVGAGPAGLSIALEFEGSGVQVCILESGGLDADADVESLNEIENVGLRRAAQDLTRARRVGGTSALWSGRCGVFDSIDYQPRTWLPRSGWPINAADVAPFVDRAGALLGLGPALYGEHAGIAFGRGRARGEPAWDADLLLPVVWQFSQHGAATAEAIRAFAAAGPEGAEQLGALQHAGAPKPRHLGEAAWPVLKASRNLRLLTHASATCIEIDAGGSKAEAVSIASLNGRSARVRAPRIVLACGGIDNARLLLASRSVDPRGVGNAHDQVGRYLTDHPYAEIGGYDGEGSKLLRRALGHHWLERRGARHVYSLGVRMSPLLQRREELLNCAVHLVEFGDEATPLVRAGQALRGLLKGRMDGAAVKGLAAGLTQPIGVMCELHDRLVRRRPPLQKPSRVAINCVVEQQLDPDSRVLLSERLDALGRPRARVDWRASDLEFRTATRMAEVMHAELSRLGLRLPTPAAWIGEGAAALRERIHDMAHPMCATRMSADPAHGVVDANAQVHGVEGLHVMGSSVFATPGYMNPTLMIVALSLRLADHLKAQFARRPLLPATPAPAGALQAALMPRRRRTRVALVGAGHRLRTLYLPVFRALAEDFELVGVHTRSPATREAFAAEAGIEAFADAGAMVAQAKPDFLLVAVSSGGVDDTARRVVELRMPVLFETPFAWSARKGRATLQRIRELQLTAGVAEQTPLLPMEQFKRQLIDLGLLGRVVAVKNDFAVFDYHGIAALRSCLGADREPVRVSAVRSQPQAAGESWLHGCVEYEDGASLVHHYSGEYHDAPWRGPRSLRVYGTAGSLIDGTLLLRGADAAASSVHEVVRETHEGRLLGLGVATPIGEVRWANPYAAHAFSDEQIAVASVLARMASAVRHGGVPAYSAADAQLDVELMTAMRFSSMRHGAAIALPLRPAIDAARAALASQLARRVARARGALVRARPAR